MNDEWRDVAGFEDKYQVSRNGEIRNKHTGKVSKGGVDKGTGYMKISLYTDKCYTHSVHRLVAKAFLPNTNNLPEIHHIDGDKQNNSANNLEWVSRKEHGGKMTEEQKRKMRETYIRNRNKRENMKVF